MIWDPKRQNALQCRQASVISVSIKGFQRPAECRVSSLDCPGTNFRVVHAFSEACHCFISLCPCGSGGCKLWYFSLHRSVVRWDTECAVHKIPGVVWSRLSESLITVLPFPGLVHVCGSRQTAWLGGGFWSIDYKLNNQLLPGWTLYQMDGVGSIRLGRLPHLHHSCLPWTCKRVYEYIWIPLPSCVFFFPNLGCKEYQGCICGEIADHDFL